MARFELKLPKMGESVAEATITNWLKEVGEKIEADEAVLEIATDKVDSEVPSEVSGVLIEKLFDKDDLVQVGQTIAIIETEADTTLEQKTTIAPVEATEIQKSIETIKETVATPANFSDSEKFFSPLVKNIASAEGVSLTELENINGSGKEGRVTKEDILKFVENRKSNGKSEKPVEIQQTVRVSAPAPQKAAPVSVSGGDEIIEMDRMRKLIAGYMVASVQTSAHTYNRLLRLT